MALTAEEKRERRNAAARKRRQDAKTASNKARQDGMHWDLEEQEQHEEYAYRHAASLGFDPSMYFPEKDGKKIPEEGAWILILEEPYTELKSRFTVPLLSMWRARPHELDSGGLQVAKDRTMYPQQAIISTPGGDLHLWPHEYVIATNPLGLVGDPDSELHQLGGQPVLDEDMMFYLQSRGIPHREAVMMLFDLITETDFIYVTFPEEITAALEGMGRSLRRHVALNPRELVDA